MLSAEIKCSRPISSSKNGFQAALLAWLCLWLQVPIQSQELVMLCRIVHRPCPVTVTAALSTSDTPRAASSLLYLQVSWF